MLNGDFFLQFAISLGAILLLAGVTWVLRLGGEPRLDSDAEAVAAARSLERGFVPIKVARDTKGRAALLVDADGRVLLLRLHGDHFVARILTKDARAFIEEDRLRVETAERRFGAAELTLNEPRSWLQKIERGAA